jgi:anthranilate phosphoribosyltransferase
MKQALQKLVERKNLSPEEARGAMNLIMGGTAGPAQAAAFLVALRMKGETKEEIAALAGAMRSHARIIRPSREPLVDTCGTGGDSSGSFNVSTTAAFIAAGAGVAIAKHGNRAVSGKCGSADVLEALGVQMLEPEAVELCINRIGIGFMFAPIFHPAMKNVAPIRRDLGMRTVFNILGPLANPANAGAQVLGVYDPNLTELMAHVLLTLGSQRALVVHSEGMDEIGLGVTRFSELGEGRVGTITMNAQDFNMPRDVVPKADTREAGASILRSVLSGVPGPALNVALLNAAAAIYVGGVAASISEGLEAARESVSSGKAMAKLEALRDFKAG